MEVGGGGRAPGAELGAEVELMSKRSRDLICFHCGEAGVLLVYYCGGDVDFEALEAGRREGACQHSIAPFVLIKGGSMKHEKWGFGVGVG